MQTQLVLIPSRLRGARLWAQVTKLSFPKRIDLLSFWLSHFGPFLVEVPKGDHLLVLGPLGN